jgi:hypothetical protein
LTGRRINRGSGHSYTIDGEPVLGVTTILSKGIPKPALTGWAAKQAAEFACDNWDDLAKLGIGAKFTKISKAPWDTLNKASVKGTKVHGYAEKLVSGEPVEIPDALRGYAEAAAKWMDKFKVEPVLTEVSVFNRTYRYAGTPDLIHWAVDKRRRGSERFIVLSDYKTSASGIWGETSLQLEANARGEFYTDGVKLPVEITLPLIDELWAIQLREDGYNRRRVLMDRDYLWRRFRAAQMVAEFCSHDREEIYSSDGDDIE